VMHLDLTDDETRALLNLLINTIETDRYPLSPRIRLCRRSSPSTVRFGGVGCTAAPLCPATTRSASDPRGARSGAGTASGLEMSLLLNS